MFGTVPIKSNRILGSVLSFLQRCKRHCRKFVAFLSVVGYASVCAYHCTTRPPCSSLSMQGLTAEDNNLFVLGTQQHWFFEFQIWRDNGSICVGLGFHRYFTAGWQQDTKEPPSKSGVEKIVRLHVYLAQVSRWNDQDRSTVGTRVSYLELVSMRRRGRKIHSREDSADIWLFPGEVGGSALYSIIITVSTTFMHWPFIICFHTLYYCSWL